MLKNTNQTAVRKLGARSLRQNKVRNIFVILAIVLTTFMFTTVFSIGFSIGKNMNAMMLRQQGTKRSIWLNQPEKKQIGQVKKAKHLNAAGIQIPTGLASGMDGKTNIQLDYYDRTEFEENFRPAISDIQGSYPEKENEIMLSQAALSAMQVQKPKQGMEIALLTDSGQKKFRLSGWFTDYTSAVGGFQGFVSRAYVMAMHKTVEQDGILSISARIGKKEALLQELNSRVSLKSEQTLESAWDVQNENTGNYFVVVIGIGLIGLIIMISGYLLIYNIMYISVTRDIRFYGMLKTIGTSPSQIRRIVKDQIIRLSGIGIPIGILSGSVLSFLAVPIAMSIFVMDENDAIPRDVSFNPFIYVGTILFAVITVTISCRKPAKLAGRISAVEALKYRGQIQVRGKNRKTTDGGKLYKMSFRNVFREKKRAFLVFASLFMGTMAFLTVNTFLGSLKVENYVDAYLPNDFTIFMTGSEEEGNNDVPDTGQPEGSGSISSYQDQFVEELGKMDGITEMNVNRTADLVLEFDADVYRPFLEKDVTKENSMQDMINNYTENADDKEKAYRAPVVAVSSAMMKRYNKRAKQKMDIKRFEKGEVCLVGNLPTRQEADRVTGKTIILKNPDTGKTLAQEIGSCPAYGEESGLDVGYYWQVVGAPSCILISDAAMAKICDRPDIHNIIINCDSKAESRVKSRIKSLVRTNPCVLYTQIKSDEISGFVSAMMAMNILGGGISFVLILIGVINFINVMLTGVFARRGELAVMESVGMTRKQVRKMLVYEGAYYGGITIFLLCTLGSAMVYLVASFARHIADYAVFHYPIGWMCILAVLILIICMLVPAVVYQVFSRESITERLKMDD